MSIRALLAAVAVVAIPIAVNGEQPPRPKKDRAEKKICTIHEQVGTRLSAVRRCMSRREHEEMRKEMGTDLTRQQALKPTWGGP